MCTCVSVGLPCVYMCVGRSAFCVHVCRSVCLVCACVSVGLPCVCMCVGQSALCVHVCWSVGLPCVCMCVGRSALCVHRVSVGLPCVCMMWSCLVCTCVGLPCTCVNTFVSRIGLLVCFFQMCVWSVCIMCVDSETLSIGSIYVYMTLE